MDFTKSIQNLNILQPILFQITCSTRVAANCATNCALNITDDHMTSYCTTGWCCINKAHSAKHFLDTWLTIIVSLQTAAIANGSCMRITCFSNARQHFSKTGYPKLPVNMLPSNCSSQVNKSLNTQHVQYGHVWWKVFTIYLMKNFPWRLSFEAIFVDAQNFITSKIPCLTVM